MRRTFLVLVVAAACHAPAPPPKTPEVACAAALPALAAQHTRNVTRVYLATFELAGGRVTIGAPALLTEKRGYVNQPAFDADGAGLYFTWRPEGGQADIWHHEIASGRERPITCTAEEEYSATPTRDGLIVLRIAADGSRALVRLGPDGRLRDRLFPGVADLGAYLWIDEGHVAMFFGGNDGSRLAIGDPRTGAMRDVASGVSAAMTATAGGGALGYVDQRAETAQLMRLDLTTGAIAPVVTLPDGVEKFAWLADGSVLAGAGRTITRASAADPTWREVGRFDSGLEGTITRVIAGAGRLAIVTRVE
jgi:hypothetical protein